MSVQILRVTIYLHEKGKRSMGMSIRNEDGTPAFLVAAPGYTDSSGRLVERMLEVARKGGALRDGDLETALVAAKKSEVSQ